MRCTAFQSFQVACIPFRVQILQPVGAKTIFRIGAEPTLHGAAGGDSQTMSYEPDGKFRIGISVDKGMVFAVGRAG